jgi:ketosteroid isomerase-like protein
VTEHPNAAVVRRLFDAFRAYDVAGVIDAISEDAVWTFPGRRSKIAGEHRGREEVIKFLTKVMMLAGGTFSVEVHDIMASDDGAVVLFTGRAKRGGKTLDNPTALHVRVRAGRAVEFHEYVWDLDHVEDFWS